MVCAGVCIRRGVQSNRGHSTPILERQKRYHAASAMSIDAQMDKMLRFHAIVETEDGMGIVTKTGDDGLTGLWSGERVRKDDPRVEAYGTVDELDSHLGEAKHYLSIDACLSIVESIQRDLYRLAGELATRTGVFVKQIEDEDVNRLGALVDRYEAELGLTGFVVPGMTLASAKLDVARTVCRRAERRVVSLAWDADVRPSLRRYLNRLSDLLFILARLEEKAAGKITYVKSGG